MSAEDTEIVAAKKALRAEVIAKRDLLPSEMRQRLSAATAREAEALSLLSGPKAVFSIYATMGSEIDPTSTLN